MVDPVVAISKPPCRPSFSARTSFRRSRDRSRFRFFLLFFFFIIFLLARSCYSRFSTYPSLLPPFIQRPIEALSSVHPSSFNNTLRSFAQIDLREAHVSREASALLDNVWKPSVGDKIWDKPDSNSRVWLESTRLKLAKAGQRLPPQLSNPRYTVYWPEFRSSLQKWVEAKRYDPAIMSSLQQLVKERVDKHYRNKGKKLGDGDEEQLRHRYTTCAVVGNSGILLNQSFATQIDAHEMVIRLNNARTTGYENHVGSKTTLAFINSNVLQPCARRNGCVCHPYGIDVPIVLYLCQLVHLMDVALCSASHEAPIIVTDPRFDILCDRIVKYYSIKNFVESTGKHPEEWSEAHDGPMFHYSSGMQAVMLALGICDKVSLFGFGRASGAKHHYHTNQQAELHLHDYTAEYQFYRDLVHNRSSFVPFLSDAGFVLPSVTIYM